MYNVYRVILRDLTRDDTYEFEFLYNILKKLFVHDILLYINIFYPWFFNFTVFVTTVYNIILGKRDHTFYKFVRWIFTVEFIV